jgi:multidrug resistance protein, MATE family
LTRQILHLAWPMLIGQLAVMANGLIDTVMAGRLSSTDLAAVGLASSFQFTVYVTLNGIIMGISPIIGQHFGAQRFAQIGITFIQGVWSAAFLSLIGIGLLLSNPGWLGLTQAPEAVLRITSTYLNWSALGLFPAMLFRAFYATSTAVSLPRVVMTIQLLMLVFKIPLNALFMYGIKDYFGGMGGAGCGLATAILAWIGFFCALWVLHNDPRYRPFDIQFRLKIDWPIFKEVLRLGLPIGLSYGIEITSFTLIAMLVAHRGIDVAASHQIASNLLGLAYMVPLALSSAISTLVAQSVGASQPLVAKHVGVAGVRLVALLAVTVAAAYAVSAPTLAGLYLGTEAGNQSVAQEAARLIQILAVFIVFDALQTVMAFILRAYKIATIPSVIYAACLWGVGLGGGWWVTHWASFTWASGAAGYWWAGTLGVLLAAAIFSYIVRAKWREADAGRVSPQIHV